MDQTGATGRLRVFFALVPDAGTQRSLGIVAREIATRARGRAIIDANLHLTLAFIGDVESPRVAALRRIVAILPQQAFTLELDSVGSFRHSDLAWIAPSNRPAQLAELHAALVHALADAHFALETRPFHPHITLVRRCTKKIANGGADRLTWRVDRVALLASIAANGGVTYRELAGLRLA